MLSLIFLGMALVVTRPWVVAAAEPPSKPVLRIDPGMHTAPIRSIAIDAAERFIVTASDDKSLRVWELSNGRLIRTIRPPIGKANEGKLSSVALSPNGKTIAAGGWTQFNNGKYELPDDGNSIYLFDRVSGNMTWRITGLPNVINGLAFSPDGQWLAAALGGQNGVRIYRTSNWSLAAEDKDYGDDSNSSDFSPDGRLVTTCYDGFVRLYEAALDDRGMVPGQVKTLSPQRKIKAPGGKKPHTARFSPDETKIAIGYHDTPDLSVLSGRDLTLLYPPAGKAGIYDLFVVGWSKDGKYLFAGGDQQQIDGAWSGMIRRWSDGGRGDSIDIPSRESTIMDLAPLQNGSMVFGSGTPSIGIVSSKGESTRFFPSATADFGDNAERFFLAEDGTKVSFVIDDINKSTALFDVSTRQLIPGGSSPSLKAPVISKPKVAVTEWKCNYTPKLNGVPLNLSKDELSRQLALATDCESFVLGTEWYLRYFDSKGRELWQPPVAVPSTTLSVNISGNGKVVAAAFADGTIRWYRLKDGKQLLTFFPHADMKRWVLWTPSGYYDASVGGEDLIGWQVNRGKDKAADFFPTSRFRDTYYRPDIIARVLTTLDVSEAVRLANAARGTVTVAPTITKILPPVVEILDPADGIISATSNTVSLRYRLRSPSDAPVTSVLAQVNARPVPTAKGGPVKFGDKDIQEINVTIPEEDCEIALLAENRNNLSVPATIRVLWKGKPPAKAPLPRLIILAVGIGKYEEKELKLDYAAKDAEDFYEAFKQQEGILYSKIVHYVITDTKAKKDDILAGLDWLEKETTSKDIAVIFLSGHGVNDPAKRHFYFLPQNAVSDNLKVTGLELSTIKNTVSNLPGKAVLLFLDTCHAGSVDLNGIINTLTESGVGAVVFASSTGSQRSWERADWQNGAFTKALVEGINGKADYQGEGEITITGLDLYVSTRVKKLTDAKQTPVVGKPTTIADFPIARKK